MQKLHKIKLILTREGGELRLAQEQKPVQNKEIIDMQVEKELKTIDQARERIIHSMAQNMDLYGLNASIGRLYGTIFFNSRPMTLDEMTDALGMSKTSMSTGVRALIEINMVQKTWKKGVRKDLYSVEEDWHKSFISLLSNKWRKEIETNESEIQKSRLELETLLSKTENGKIKEEIQRDLKKLNQSIEYYDWFKRLVDSFETGSIYEFIPRKIDRDT
jgi:DNA-binding transcriptional regulator GbsR (MarR family)